MVTEMLPLLRYSGLKQVTASVTEESTTGAGRDTRPATVQETLLLDRGLPVVGQGKKLSVAIRAAHRAITWGGRRL
jgi:hypothetical protein